MFESQSFYLGKKKDNMSVNLSEIKGGIKFTNASQEETSIFNTLLDENSDGILDKEEIDKFINEIKEFAKDNNLSISEAAKYLKMKNIQQLKTEDLFKLIKNLETESQNIAESSVINSKDGKKTILIRYKDNSEETIYPDKSSKQELIGENGEKITKNYLPTGEISSEVVTDKNSKTTTRFSNNQPETTVVEKNGEITTTTYENNQPTSKEIKIGESVRNFTYIDGKELLTYSKTFQNKQWGETRYTYNDNAQVLSFEEVRGNATHKELFEYHDNSQVAKQTRIEIGNSENLSQSTQTTVTYDETGKRLTLDYVSNRNYKGTDMNTSSSLKFDKNGNIVGYVPINSTLSSVLKELDIKSGTEVYNKFMELNKDKIKNFNNGKVKGFDVGAKIIIPGEVEERGVRFYQTNPKDEKDFYTYENLGHTDTQGIPTEDKVMKQTSTWWAVAKQNLIDIGVKNPTDAQVAENLDVLISLNNSLYDINSPIEKGRSIIVRSKESENLSDKYKISSYNIKTLRKNYPADKFKITKTRINPLVDEFGGEPDGIYAYHIYDKKSGKKTLSVIPSTDTFSKNFTVHYFAPDGKETSALAFSNYSGINETLYSKGTTIENSYDKNGTLVETIYTDPKTKLQHKIKNPKSPNKEINISGGNYYEFQKYSNGKLSQRLVNNKLEYYDKDGKFSFSVKENYKAGILQIDNPRANKCHSMLKSSNFSGALQIINKLDENSYKAFLCAYQSNNGIDLIDDIQDSKLPQQQKMQLLSHIRKLINEDNKITNPNRTSQVSAPYYKGAPYNIRLKDDILTIHNKKSGQTSTINLKEYLSECTEFERAVIKKNMVDILPGEVLEDIAKESRKIKVSPKMHIVSNNDGFEAAGYYSSRSDLITLSRKEIYNIHAFSEFLGIGKSNVPEIITHEFGHAIDYNGFILNTASSSGNTFKAVFEKELKKYIASGKQQFSYEKGFKVEGKFVQNDEGGSYDTNSSYATANEQEMFAECYTLMILGDCQSKDHILKYFPETFKAAKSLLAEIRAKSDDERYNRIHL